MSKFRTRTFANLPLTIAAIATFVAALCPVAAHAKAGVIFDFENGTQGWSGNGVSFSQAATGATSGKHSLKIANYDGSFVWIGSDQAASSAARALHNASLLYFDVTFTSNVVLKKDKRGNQWFSFIAAAVGADGKWRQGKGMVAVPVVNGVLKAGTYPLKLAIADMPKPAADSAKLTIKLGPNSSGLAKPITFYIDSVRTAK